MKGTSYGVVALCVGLLVVMSTTSIVQGSDPGTGRPWNNTAVLTSARALSGAMTTDDSMFVDVFDNIHVFYTGVGSPISYHDFVYLKSDGSWTDYPLFTSSTIFDPPWVNTASISTTGLSGSLGLDKNAILVDSSGMLHLFYWSPTEKRFYHQGFANGEWRQPTELYLSDSGTPRPWTNTVVLTQTRALSGTMPSYDSMLVDSSNNLHIFHTTPSTPPYTYRDCVYRHSELTWSDYPLFTSSVFDPPWPNTASISMSGLSGSFNVDKNAILIDTSGNLDLLFWIPGSPGTYYHRPFYGGLWYQETSLYSSAGTSRPWTHTVVLTATRTLFGSMVSSDSMLVDASNNLHLFRTIPSYAYRDLVYRKLLHSWMEWTLFTATVFDPPWPNTASISMIGLSGSLGPNKNSILIDTTGSLELFYWTPKEKAFFHRQFTVVSWGASTQLYTSQTGTPRPWSNTVVLTMTRTLSGTTISADSMLVDMFNNLHLFRYVPGGNYAYHDLVYRKLVPSWADYTLFSSSVADSPWLNIASIATTGLSGSLGSEKNAVLIDSQGDLDLLYLSTDGYYHHRAFTVGVWGLANRLYYSTLARAWSYTTVLTFTRELSGTVRSGPSMFVDVSNNLHLFYLVSAYHDLAYVKSPPSWTDNVLFASTAPDSPWLNIASIATTGLSGSLGTDKNAILVDTAGDLDLLYFDPADLYFYHRGFVGDVWSVAIQLYSAEGGTGTPRPWTNTAVLTETRAVAGPGMNGNPSMLVDLSNNLHLFYGIQGAQDKLYFDVVYRKLTQDWSNVLLYTSVGYASWVTAWASYGSIATTGFSGFILATNAFIMIDTEGDLDVFWISGSHYFRGFADGVWGDQTETSGYSWYMITVLSETRTLSGPVSPYWDGGLFFDARNNIHLFETQPGAAYDHLYVKSSLIWMTYTLWTGGATKVYGPWNNLASIATTGLDGSLSTYGNDGILIDSQGDLELLYCPSANDPMDCTAIYQRMFKDDTWGPANHIPAEDQLPEFPWSVLRVLTSTRELSGSTPSWFEEMFVDSSDNLHLFEYSADSYTDTVWTKSATSWTHGLLLTSSILDPPWFNLASIATTGLSGSLGIDENALLSDTEGNIDLFYWDPNDLNFYSRVFADDTWGSATALFVSYDGTGRPWTNTAVLTETRTLSGPGMTTDPSLLVDVVNNLHVFYIEVIYWPPTYIYHDAVYIESDKIWADETLFYVTGNDPPWLHTASIATTGLSGSLGTNNNAILIDSEGALNLMWWSTTDYYLYHRAFVSNEWSPPNILYEL